MERANQSKNMNRHLLGYLIVNGPGSIEAVPMYSDTRSVRFRGGADYQLHMHKKNITLVYKLFAGNQSAIVEQQTADINVMIKSRADDIHHRYDNINCLVKTACTEEDPKAVMDDISFCSGIIQKHLTYLQDPDLLRRVIEVTETTTLTTITLNPGMSANILTLRNGYDNDSVNVTWTPSKMSSVDPKVVTVDKTVSSSLFLIDLSRQTKSILNNTLKMFNIPQDENTESKTTEYPNTGYPNNGYTNSSGW
jgi:hypothetical protein